MKRNDILILAAGLLVGAGLAIFIYFGLDLINNKNGYVDELPGVSLPESAAVGSRAPDFELVNLVGETVKLSELRGKIVILNFGLPGVNLARWKCHFLKSFPGTHNQK